LIHSNICSILVAMTAPSPDLSAALATLRSRWGAAAPGVLGAAGSSGSSMDGAVGEVMGALATVPLRSPVAEPQPDPSRIFSTGFAELDAILGPGGVPRGMGIALRGDASSGRTTLALRLAAEAQAAGAIVAWLDLAAALDPVEAAARGVELEWLVVVTPADPQEGLAIAGSLLSGRAVDLLVIDLPGGSARAAGFADRLARVAALARRAGISLVVLEPPSGETGRSGGLAGAVGEATGIRLELARRSWIRLGRDVVGQRTEVLVARNRAGPPGRRTTLELLYADGGERDACLRRSDLLSDDASLRPVQPTTNAPFSVPEKNHATAASPSPASAPRSREAAPALRLVAGGADRPRRETVVERERPRRGPRREGARRPARDAARVGAPAGAGGDVPRRRAGG
jgi:RecA/RadA recombinase